VDDLTFGFGSDIVFDTSAVVYSNLSPSPNVEVTPTIASSTSGTAVITYSLDSSSPNWVSIDSFTGRLTLDMTGIAPGSAFNFKMLAKVSISTVGETKQITLEIKECSPLSNGSCAKCEDFDPSVCVQCKKGYTLVKESNS